MPVSRQVASRHHLVCLVLAPLLMTAACGQGSSSAAPAGLSATVLVLPFGTGDSTPPAWNSAVFAESLAADLSRVQGVDARPAHITGDQRVDYTLHGDVAGREGRIVIATRLRRWGEGVDAWSATFWRPVESSSKLVAFLTVPITEAVFTDLARRAATSKKED